MANNIGAIPTERQSNLIWMRAVDLDKLGELWVVRELRRRLVELPQVGFLKPPYVRQDSRGEVWLSMQAVCVLCANSLGTDSNAIERMAPAIYDKIFAWARDQIVSNEAYPPFELPPRPWKPFGPIPKRRG